MPVAEDVVVRAPMTIAEHPRRRLEERLGLRFPRLLDILGKLLWRLPPSSRMRRAVERRYLRIAWEAFNRQDLAATFMLYHPECDCTWDPRFPSLGIESRIHGRGERIRAQEQILSEWEYLRFYPEEVIQVDDRVISLGHMRGAGPISGAEVEIQWMAEFTLRDGRVERERIFVDHAEGLAAAGLA
jgi:ketosteroid isomerase-like protein